MAVNFNEEQMTAGIFAVGSLLGAAEFMSSGEFGPAGNAFVRFSFPLYCLYFVLSALAGGVLAFIIFQIGGKLYGSFLKDGEGRGVRTVKTIGLLAVWLVVLFFFTMWLYK